MDCLVESRAGWHLVNEDRYISEPELPFYAVLDGEVHEGYAADVAVTTLRAHLTSIRHALAHGYKEASHALSQAVQRAHSAVFEVSTTPAKRGCGTTLTCCALSGQDLLVAHVGDSRLYYRDTGRSRRITTDHSLIEEMRSAGLHSDLNKESIALHGNVVTHVLGLTPE